MKTQILALVGFLFAVSSWAAAPPPSPTYTNVTVQGNISVGGNQTVTGTSHVTGAVTLDSNLSVGGNLTLTGTFNGAQPWALVSSLTALKALAVSTHSAGYSVALNGYYTAGDMPTGIYVLSKLSCTLNAGSGDGGLQIPSNTLNNCWVLQNQPAYSPKQWGAVDGTATNATTGTVGSGSAAVTLSAAGDFVNGDPIALVGAGATFTASSPSGLALSPRGSASTAATYYYTVASLDANLGVGAAITPVSVQNSATLATPLAVDSPTLIPAFAFTASIAHTGGVDVLTVTGSPGGTMALGQKLWGVNGDLAFQTTIVPGNCGSSCTGAGGTGTYQVANFKGISQSISSETMYAAVPGVYNQISWTAGAGASSTVIYEGATNTLSSMNCIAVVSGTGPNGTMWQDYGSRNYQKCPSWIPVHPLSVAQNDVFSANILSGAGTTSVVLDANSSHASTTGLFFHDSTTPLANILARGVPVVSDCATYNTLSTLTIINAGFHGGGQGCTIIRGLGAANIINQASVDTFLDYLDIDASQEVAGFALSISTSRTRDGNINVYGPYNQIEVQSSLNMDLRFFRATASPGGLAASSLRGDYGMYAHTPSGGTPVVQNMMLYSLTIPKTTSAISYYQHGAVNGTRGYYVDIQSGPHEFIVDDNTSAAASNFGMFYNSGTNFAWNDNVALLDDVAGYIFERFYCQGNTGNMSNGVYIGAQVNPGGGPVAFTDDSQIFGNDLNGIENHGWGLQIDNTTLIGGNSGVTTGVASKVFVAADAQNGQSLLFGSGDRQSGGTTSQVPSEKYGVYIASGFNSGATWQGFPLVQATSAGGGTDASVCDNTGQPGMVQVDGRINWGSCANVAVANALGVTLTAAQFVPTVIGGTASIYRSQQGSGLSDTTPTATLIFAQINQPAIGQFFTFRVTNIGGHTITLAGGTSVVISGTATTPINTVHDFQCTLTGTLGMAPSGVNCKG